MPPKQILFVTNAFGWGGLEKHLEDLILRLDPTCAEPIILCFGPDVNTRSLNDRYGLNITIQDEARSTTFLGY